MSTNLFCVHEEQRKVYKNKPASCGFSAHREGFYLSPTHMGFVVNRILRFSPVSINQ